MTCLLAAFGLLVAGALWILAPAVLVVPLLNQGRYARAFARLRWLRWCLGARLLEAVTLFHLGELEEAEHQLRRLEARRGLGTATRAYVHLGQGDYPAALVAARQALGPDPERSPYRVVASLAELFAGEVTVETRMRLDAELTEREAEPDTSPLGLDEGWRAEALAARSWAHAQLGTLAQSHHDAAEAVRHVPPSNPHVGAQVALLLGLAARARQEARTAREHLEYARRADPQGGVWGRVARRVLRERPVGAG